MLNMYAAHKAEVWFAVIILAMALCLLHYLLFGPRRTTEIPQKESGLVRRFNTRERFFHWATMLVFLVVMVSGIGQVLGGTSSHHLGPLHGNLGVVLLIIFVINIITWFKDSLFRNYDWIWLKSMGGYVSRNNVHLPAGRFNAGQKIYYWLILGSFIALLVSAILMEQNGHGPHTLATRQSMMWSIHGLVGCFATTMVIGHAYLSILANPQTAKVLWNGFVSRSYAEEHHSRWEF